MLLFLLWRNRFDSVSMLLYMAALGISCIQFVTTNAHTHTNDIIGHLSYIAHIHGAHSLPPPDGWQSQQPPLYYLVAAAFCHLGDYFNASGAYAARIASVWFYYGAMLFSGLLLRLYIPRLWLFRMCLACLLFWPAAAHMSVKISNDIGQFFFACGFCYYFGAWWLRNKNRSLVSAMWFCAGAMLTKGSAILLPFLLVCAVAWKCYNHKLDITIIRKRSFLLALLVLVVGCSFNFARIEYWRNTTNADVKWLINRGEDYLNTYEHAQNSLSNYLSFDFQHFVEIPFARFYNTDVEAQYVFNILLKTFIYGDASFDHGIGLASVINLLFLFVIALFIALYYARRKTQADGGLTMATILVMAAAIAMVVSARIMVPVTWQGTARYIYVVVVLFLALYGRFLSQLSDGAHKKLVWVACFALISFMLCALSFTLVQWSWPVIPVSVRVE